MGDQAEAMKYSVAFISAVELGKRPIPEDYVSGLARWLDLSSDAKRRLQLAADSSHKLVPLRPDSPEKSAFSAHLARKLNELTATQIKELRRIVDEGNVG